MTAGDLTKPIHADYPTNIPAMIVGGCSVLSALLGLCGDAFGIFVIVVARVGNVAQAVPESPGLDRPLSNLPLTILLLSASILCKLIVFYCGIDLLLSRLRCSRLLSIVFLTEIILLVGLFLPFRLSFDPVMTSIVAMGLLIQFIMLVPFWGPLVLWWANSGQASNPTIQAGQHVYQEVFKTDRST